MWWRRVLSKVVDEVCGWREESCWCFEEKGKVFNLVVTVVLGILCDKKITFRQASSLGSGT